MWSLYTCFVLGLVSTVLANGSLNIVVPPRNRECLFLEKKIGDMLNVNIQVISGGSTQMHLILYDPEMKVIFAEPKLEEKRVKERALKDGGYSFCFDNFDQMRKSKVIQFDYDLHIEDDKSAFVKRLESEEKKFLKKLTLRETERMIEDAKRQGKLTDEDTEKYLAKHKEQLRDEFDINGEKEDFLTLVNVSGKLVYSMGSNCAALRAKKCECRR